MQEDGLLVEVAQSAGEHLDESNSEENEFFDSHENVDEEEDTNEGSDNSKEKNSESDSMIGLEEEAEEEYDEERSQIDGIQEELVDPDEEEMELGMEEGKQGEEDEEEEKEGKNNSSQDGHSSEEDSSEDEADEKELKRLAEERKKRVAEMEGEEDNQGDGRISDCEPSTSINSFHRNKFAQNKEQAAALQEVMENMLEEFAKDVVRINARYLEIRRFLIRFFGTAPDGTITNSFDNHNIETITEESVHRSFFSKREKEEFSYITKEMRKSRYRKTYASPSSSSEEDEDEETFEPKEKERRSQRVADNEQKEGPSRAAAKKLGPREQKALSYPFVEKSDEEKIFKNCGNIPSQYAQRLAKILFADSLELYFKDQEPRKREWLHQAVDYRFPTPDKYNHAIKWKNCSNSINKNMREFNKNKESQRLKATKEINDIYISKEKEQDCYLRAGGDPIKYAEYLSLILFEGRWDKFFKEQDQKRKDWLRECLDRRYPVNDREKSSHRWKICAAACNRNRTKVVSADGKENPFPYFPQEIEEEAFADCNGVPAVYAEIISKHLFPSTAHLMFKEQELGKRHWLHHHVDQRFPTPGKLEHAAKWKSITQAINKNMTKQEDQPAPSTSTNGKGEKSAKKEEPIKKEISRKRSEPTVKEELDNSTEPENKRPRRAIRESQKMQEALSDSPTSAKKGKSKVKTEPYSRYPYVSQAKEIDIFENSKNNAQIYAKKMGAALFANSLNLYYKDQDPERRQWMREIIDFRFPTPNAGEHKQKWKNVCAAINKNMFQRS